MDHLCQKAEIKLLDEAIKNKVLETKLPEKKELEDVVDNVEDMDIDISTEMKIKTETEDSDMNEITEEIQFDEKRPKKHPASEENDSEGTEPPPPTKVWRGLRYKSWSLGVIQPPTKYKKPTDREITEVCKSFESYLMFVTQIPDSYKFISLTRKTRSRQTFYYFLDFSNFFSVTTKLFYIIG